MKDQNNAREEASRQLRGLFAGVDPHRVLSEELIAERSEEAQREDRNSSQPSHSEMEVLSSIFSNEERGMLRLGQVRGEERILPLRDCLMDLL